MANSFVRFPLPEHERWGLFRQTIALSIRPLNADRLQTRVTLFRYAFRKGGTHHKEYTGEVKRTRNTKGGQPTALTSHWL